MQLSPQTTAPNLPSLPYYYCDARCGCISCDLRLQKMFDNESNRSRSRSRGRDNHSQHDDASNDDRDDHVEIDDGEERSSRRPTHLDNSDSDNFNLYITNLAFEVLYF
jgi:hypothetical protein